MGHVTIKINNDIIKYSQGCKIVQIANPCRELSLLVAIPKSYVESKLACTLVIARTVAGSKLKLKFRIEN